MSDGYLHDPDHHAARVGEILNEFLDHRASGMAVDEQELLAAHPDIADELRAALGVLDDLKVSSDKIGQLIRLGALSATSEPQYAARLYHYQIIDQLGRGGMGVVLRAYEPELDRLVAIKFLKPELADDSDCRRRFTREAQAAARLKHPNIVEIHAVGESAGVPYFVMEYINGLSLAEAIKSSQQSACSDLLSADSVASPPRGRRSSEQPSGMTPSSNRWDEIPKPPSSISDPATIRHIFCQLLDALAVAHDAGLIHRDVKSSNILLEDGGAGDCGIRHSVKLADFGLARMLSSQSRVTATDSVLGTPEYMSPEQARGDADIDPRTDLYSAGVVLYEMLTGRMPFKATTSTGVIHQILNIEPPDPRTIDKNADPVLTSIAMRLLMKERDQRFVTTRDVIGALQVGKIVRRPGGLFRWSRLAFVIVLIAVMAWSAHRVNILFEQTQKATDAVNIRDTERIRGVELSGDNCGIHIYRGSRAYPEVLEWPYLTDYEEKWQDNPYGHYAAAVLVETPQGSCIAIAFTHFIDEESNTLALFTLEGDLLWRQRFYQPYAWPDDDNPQDCWGVGLLIKGNLDDQPGQELVVLAHNRTQYPSRLAIVDTVTGEIRSSFWHMGVLSKVRVFDDFFGPGKPAVVAAGINNKLDGSETIQPGDPAPLVAQWDKVPVMLVLDPANLNGLGPPYMERLGIPPASPSAYAYLDISAEKNVGRRTTGDSDRIGVSEWAGISSFALDHGDKPYNAGDIANLRVVIDYQDDGKNMATANLILDCELNLLHVDIPDQDQHLTEDNYWRQRWYPICQRGEYKIELQNNHFKEDNAVINP